MDNSHGTPSDPTQKTTESHRSAGRSEPGVRHRSMTSDPARRGTSVVACRKMYFAGADNRRISVAAPLVLREGDRSRLESLTRSSSIRAGLALRALAADGWPNAEIARKTGTSHPAVVDWRARYDDRWIAALGNAPRSGGPPRIDEVEVVGAHALR